MGFDFPEFLTLFISKPNMIIFKMFMNTKDNIAVAFRYGLNRSYGMGIFLCTADIVLVQQEKSLEDIGNNDTCPFLNFDCFTLYVFKSMPIFRKNSFKTV